MRKLLIRIWLGVLIGLCCTSEVLAAATDSRVFVEGNSHGDEAVRSSGHDVPLLHALEQVVPSSYSVNVPNAGAWADMPVSWRPGRSFVRVLGELLASNPALEARVNTDLRLVTVIARAMPPVAVAVAAHNITSAAPTKPSASLPSPPDGARQVEAVSAPGASAFPAGFVTAPTRPPQATQAMRTDADATTAPANLAVPAKQSFAPKTPGTVNAATGGAPAPSATMSAPTPAPPVNTEWKLNLADGTVRTVLARWANEAGWQFIWEVPTDFTVDASATIHGSFEHALNAVVDALSGSQVPIQVVLYKGNHVMRVVAKGAG